MVINIRAQSGVPMTDFHLCSIGWDLYDIWCDLEENKLATSAEKTAARKAYLKHRAECEDCTKEKQDDRNHQSE